ncbi:hypothetical protein SARC_09509 [Sphaeroforma arctica JP610]|uniref:Uncharacterized protein n=1 Tax=Sphaeroforma arctica JP610 TaxID=667725 RepID=A0A0L0FMQ5_9EUKA|nr:hypothetical protein SARC_09509 [Sphaeroforma arctica JP610]KNC78044.1 hypothetical protein SARC_09509 [Sphaeroforma arctica JP610]|eukprot:XP_014151946.1 hypothetical protein SARC_09509 [Sphaeroforma arctica JP610]
MFRASLTIRRALCSATSQASHTPLSSAAQKLSLYPEGYVPPKEAYLNSLQTAKAGEADRRGFLNLTTQQRDVLRCLTETPTGQQYIADNVVFHFPKKARHCLTGKNLWDLIGNKKNLGVGDLVCSRRMFEMFQGSQYYIIKGVKPKGDMKGGKIFAALVKEGTESKSQPIRGALKKKWKLLEEANAQ